MKMDYNAVLPEVPETDKAYAAGIIEGEGCIGVYHSNGGYTSPNGAFYLTVIVQMRDPEIVEWLSETFGGSVSHPKTDYGGHHKWSVSGKYAGQVLEAIRPFMKLKGSHADLGITFASTYPRANDYFSSRNTKPSDEVMATRASICETFRVLNARRTKEPKAEIILLERKEA